MPQKFLTTEELQSIGLPNALRIGTMEVLDKKNRPVDTILTATFKAENYFEEVYVYEGDNRWRWDHRLHRGYEIKKPHSEFKQEFLLNLEKESLEALISRITIEE